MPEAGAELPGLQAGSFSLMCTGVEIALVTSAIISTTAAVAGTVLTAQQSRKAAKQEEQIFSQESVPEPPEPPPIPEPEVIKEEAKQEALERRARAARTVFTPPLSLVPEEKVAKKKLLGA